tara:strand:+ start:4805 stop:6121 length:1317 start_codon:yes stop_codon:yes gene_type:complete
MEFYETKKNKPIGTFLFSEFRAEHNFINYAKKLIEKQPIWYDESKNWWVWDFNKKCWVMQDETDIMNSIDTFTQIPSTNSNIKQQWLEALKRIGRLNKPKKINKTWIQFKNKIIDIKTDKVFESTPKYFSTNPLIWNIGEEENTPVMDKIFEEWVGKEYVQTLYEIIAFCLLPDYPLHRMFCFIGEGMNGKSCYLTLLKNFIGSSNVTSTELDTLLESRFEITRLHKKLVCIMGETNFNELNKTSKLKKLTGQDLIGFEYKNKLPFEDVNYAKIIMATNNLPTTTDKTIGFYRRWLIVDFPNKFNENKNILDDVPIQEYENLSLKLIHLLKELLKKREFHNEGSIEERTKKYEDKSNPLQKFWDENIEEDYNSHIFKFEFKDRLKQWCEQNRFRILTDVIIGKLMKEKNIETSRITPEWYEKDGIKPQWNAWVGIKWK